MLTLIAAPCPHCHSKQIVKRGYASNVSAQDDLLLEIEADARIVISRLFVNRYAFGWSVECSRPHNWNTTLE
jgi:hypothetical protein